MPFTIGKTKVSRCSYATWLHLLLQSHCMLRSGTKLWSRATRSQKTLKIVLRIHLSERKRPHRGRPGSSKLYGMYVSGQLTTCQEQTTLLKVLTAVLSPCFKCQTQISENSSKPFKDSFPCRPLLYLSGSWARKCTRGKKITLKV